MVMDNGLWIALVIVTGIVVYVWGKVRYYMRQSDAQWRKVDRSKLRSWDDEDLSD